jgi:hypothetical protein
MKRNLEYICKKKNCILLYIKNWNLITFSLQNLSMQMPANIYHLFYRNYDIPIVHVLGLNYYN